MNFSIQQLLKSTLIVFVLFTGNQMLMAQDDANSFVLQECERPKDQDYLNARTTVAREWNITYRLESTCDIDPSFKDWVQKKNLVMSEKIAQKYGTDWSAKYSKEIEDELVRQKEVKQLISNQDYISKMDTSQGAVQILLRKKPDNVYAVIVLGMDDWEGRCQLLVYYKILVDNKTKTVTIKSDQKQPLK